MLPMELNFNENKSAISLFLLIEACSQSTGLEPTLSCLQ